jgi:hypothetical protein
VTVVVQVLRRAARCSSDGRTLQTGPQGRVVGRIDVPISIEVRRHGGYDAVHHDVVNLDAARMAGSDVDAGEALVLRVLEAELNGAARHSRQTHPHVLRPAGIAEHVGGGAEGVKHRRMLNCERGAAKAELRRSP